MTLTKENIQKAIEVWTKIQENARIDMDQSAVYLAALNQELKKLDLKMHLYMISRGIKFEVDRMITQLQGKTLPMDYKGEKMIVDLSVRPIQLWEIVFPEPQLQVMLKTFERNIGLASRGNGKNRNGIPQMALRKMLKASPIPKIDSKNKSYLPINRGAVEINLIGIRKDIFKDGFEQL